MRKWDLTYIIDYIVMNMYVLRKVIYGVTEASVHQVDPPPPDDWIL